MSFIFPDISEWNKNADVAGILRKSGGHIILRAGYGPSRKDFMFDSFRAQCDDAKTVGIYHFVTKGGSVADNAQAMIEWVGKTRPNEYLVLDVEAGSGNWTAAQCRDYMSRVQKRCGGKVLIYANEYYASTGGRESLFTSTTGWVAKYSNTKPSVPFLIWQSAGTVNNKGIGSNITNWPGVGTNGDTNIVFVSESKFMDIVLENGGTQEEDDDMVGLKKGDEGERVKDLQLTLNATGLVDLKVDGQYGPNTSGGVVKVRKSVGSNQTNGDRITGWAAHQIDTAWMKAVAG